MVSLLIVSHSSRIAEGVKELADQMTRGSVQIGVAGGLEDGSLGTSVDLIRERAETLASDDGLLVLVDLGSAVMSAELALEGFGKPFMLSNAPLVEGALLAAVQASIGADLQATAGAAEQAREFQKIGEP